MVTARAFVDDFSKEEVSSTCGYPSVYTGARPVGEQLAILKAVFPQLESHDAAATLSDALSGSEGVFVIPDWRTIASTYGEAVKLLFAALERAREGRFVNREYELGSDFLRESAKKIEFFEKLGQKQGGRVIRVVRAQFGIRHRGRSVQRARFVMGDLECGLGVFEIGIMLLTHPDRFVDADDLWIDCSGDECNFGPDGSCYFAPCFFFREGRLHFSKKLVSHGHSCFGSASAFVAGAK